MRELRVFPSRTSYTPTDPKAFVGDPGLWRPEGIERILVSCTFTWEMAEARRLSKSWRDQYPNADVQIGGPAFDDPGGPFVPGRFVGDGVTISSRGCPERCPWCLARQREGDLRLLPIAAGWIVNDNNVTAWPREHWDQLCRMLGMMRKGAVFAGGLQAARLKDWHVEALNGMRIDQVFFAADTEGALPALRRAGAMLKLPLKKKRCYVMLGFNGETIDKAKRRLENVWDAGFIPCPQL